MSRLATLRQTALATACLALWLTALTAAMATGHARPGDQLTLL